MSTAEATIVAARPPSSGSTPDLEERFLEPEGFVWGQFQASDGAQLRWGRLDAPGARAHCVVIGGFKEYIEKYFEILRELAARGFSVAMLDWRAQGANPRPTRWPMRPRARDWERDTADLVEFAQAVLPRDRPRILVAHSMGGAIALLGLAAAPALFRAAVLSAPMLRLKTGDVPHPLARAIALGAVSFGFRDALVPGAPKDVALSPEGSRTTSDPARCRIHQAWYDARPELVVDNPTYGWLDSAFRVTARVGNPQFLRGIATPILIGSAGRERFVDPVAHRAAAACLPNARLYEMPESKHEPFLERDAIRTPWLHEVERFIRELA